MSAVRVFRSALEEALKPQGLKPKLRRAGHRASSHLIEIDTRPRATVLYVKESKTARGFWGLTKSHLDRLNKADVTWFAVLLRCSAEKGYLLNGS